MSKDKKIKTIEEFDKFRMEVGTKIDNILNEAMSRIDNLHDIEHILVLIADLAATRFCGVKAALFENRIELFCNTIKYALEESLHTIRSREINKMMKKMSEKNEHDHSECEHQKH